MLAKRLDLALGEVEFGLAMRSTGEIPVILKALQDEWYGLDEFEKARDGGDTPDAGNHHEAALGREERAFFQALTSEQQRAYEALKEMLRGMTPEQWSRFDPFAVDPIVDRWKQAAMMLLAPQAMRSYLVGQLLAAQQMGTAQHLPMSEQDKRAIDFLSHYQFNEISQSFENLKSDLRRHLISGVQEGRHPIEVARGLANQLKDYTTQWDVVAITETARAQTSGRLQEYRDEGLTHVEFSTANDPRVCATCAEFEGRVFPISEVEGKSNYGRKRDEWLPIPPVHPRCRCVLLAYIEDNPLRRIGKTASDLLKVDLTLSHILINNGLTHQVTAYHGTREVGRVTTSAEHTPAAVRAAHGLGEHGQVIEPQPGTQHVIDAWVHPDYRRQGVATRLYNHAEQHLGVKLTPNPYSQSADAKAFWAARTQKAALLKVIDRTGRKHDEKGQFARVSRDARKREDALGTPAYGHGGYGAVPSGTYSSHAGVHGWDPGQVSLGYSVQSGSREMVAAIAQHRWDALLKPLEPLTGAHGEDEQKEAREWNEEIIERASGWLRMRIMDVERALARKRNKSPDDLALARAAHANLYYDYARADLASHLPAVLATSYLQRTAPLAAAIAAAKPDNVEAAFTIGEALPRFYTPIEMANEYYLYQFSMTVHVPASNEAVKGVPGAHLSAAPSHTFDSYEDAFGDYVTLTRQDFITLDKVLRAAYDGWLRGLEGTAMAFRYRTSQGGVRGYAHPSVRGGPCVIGINPNLKGADSHDLRSDEHKTTIIHEMAHLQERRNLSAQMDRFNAYMRRVAKAASEARGGSGRPTATLTQPNEARWTELLTAHGYNQSDYDHFPVALNNAQRDQWDKDRSYDKGDFHEDWAISLASYLLHFSAPRGGLVAAGGQLADERPRYETVKALQTIFGGKLATPWKDNLIEQLDLPRLPSYLPPENVPNP